MSVPAATTSRRRKSPPRPRGPREGPSSTANPLPSPCHYRLVFEHRLIGMYRTTLDGQILDCNESMAKMLGYASRRDLLRRKAADLYPAAEDREAFLARLRRRRGVLTNSELRLRRKDGGSMYVLENVCLVRGRRGEPTTIQGTMVDITALKQAERELRDSEQRYRNLAEELRCLAQRVQEVREAGRSRIARELHDELGQALTALTMDLHWLRERAARKLEIPDERVNAMCALVGQSIHALRRICTDLRPALLDDLGLVPAIEWQAREFQSRTGVRCTVSLPRSPFALSGDQATAVFRILQESLTNIARHARATRASVALRVRGKTLTLTVRDDGVGILQRKLHGVQSLGLMGMRERAIQWRGELDVRGARGKGTTITLRLPLAPSRAEAAT